MLAVLAIGAAEARPDVRMMSCAEVNDMVRAEGAVVMTTGTETYRRFVYTRAYCQRDEVLQTVAIGTADDPRCPVRGVCEFSQFDDLRGFRDR